MGERGLNYFVAFADPDFSPPRDTAQSCVVQGDGGRTCQKTVDSGRIFKYCCV